MQSSPSEVLLWPAALGRLHHVAKGSYRAVYFDVRMTEKGDFKSFNFTNALQIEQQFLLRETVTQILCPGGAAVDICGIRKYED